MPGRQAPARAITTDGRRRQRRPDARRPGGRRAERPGPRTSRAGDRGPSPPAPTSCAWTSRTAASPTRCSTISTGRQTIRSAIPTTTPGWTFGELCNVQVVRVTDVEGARRGDGAGQGRGAAAGRRRPARAASSRSTTTPTRRSSTLRYRLKDAQFDAAEEPFEAAGQKFNRGSFIIRNVARRRSATRRRPSWASRPWRSPAPRP